MKLLLSSAGRRVALLECFRADARTLGIDLNVVATDLDPARSAACQVADASTRVPRCDDPAFVRVLAELCRREAIDLLVPTIDTELLVLAEQREMFAAIGTTVAVSSPDVVALARNKLRTAEWLEQVGIDAPRSVPLATFLAAPTTWDWPVLLKPIGGSSSKGLHLVDGVEQARSLGLPSDSYVAQEYCRGTEYTVNLFFDQSGCFRTAVPHERIEVRAGEVSKGVTTRLPALMAAAERIGTALRGARGPLCFQAIVDEAQRVRVFEINARFGGGYPLAHRAGACFSRWLLEEVAARPSSVTDAWTQGVTMLRYDAAVFLEAASV